MTFNEAAQFLAATPIDNSQPAQWADLGCGTGLFTKVLSARLHNGSHIYAVDKKAPTDIHSTGKDITITPIQANFVEDDLKLHNLNGVLMANSLHYVKNKTALIHKLKTYLLPNAAFIIIEYNTTRANQWVPYPVSFTTLQELFVSNGYKRVDKTGERKSLYQSGGMYACLIQP